MSDTEPYLTPAFDSRIDTKIKPLIEDIAALKKAFPNEEYDVHCREHDEFRESAKARAEMWSTARKELVTWATRGVIAIFGVGGMMTYLKDHLK